MCKNDEQVMNESGQSASEENVYEEQFMKIRTNSAYKMRISCRTVRLVEDYEEGMLMKVYNYEGRFLKMRKIVLMSVCTIVRNRFMR